MKLKDLMFTPLLLLITTSTWATEYHYSQTNNRNLIQKVFINNDNSVLTQEKINTRNDKIIINLVETNDGKFLLNALNQTPEAITQMEKKCQSLGMELDYNAEIRAGKNSVPLLPCISHKSLEKKTITTIENTPNAMLSACSINDVQLLFSMFMGPGQLQLGQVGTYTINANFEFMDADQMDIGHISASAASGSGCDIEYPVPLFGQGTHALVILECQPDFPGTHLGTSRTTMCGASHLAGVVTNVITP